MLFSDDLLRHVLAGLQDGGSGAARTPPLPPPIGLRAPGNLDPWNRPILHNPDGSFSTTSSTSFSTPEGEVLVPTVVNGKRLSPDEAFAHYAHTGEHFGIFDTPENADRYATMLHNLQALHITSVGGENQPAPLFTGGPLQPGVQQAQNQLALRSGTSAY